MFIGGVNWIFLLFGISWYRPLWAGTDGLNLNF